MTPDDSAQPFRLHMTSLLRRLQAAGWIKHYEDIDPDSDEPPVIEWNEELKPMSGKAMFYALASMLQTVCAEKPLSEDEQGMILILRDIFFER